MDPAQWQKAERFIEHLKLERRLSEHTARAYRRDLGCLAEFCDRNGIPGFTELKSHQLRRFAAVSHAGGLAPRSIQRRLSGVRSFMKYLIREGTLKSNPGADVAAPQVARRLPDTLDADQMARLLKIEGSEPDTVRDRAIHRLR